MLENYQDLPRCLSQTQALREPYDNMVVSISILIGALFVLVKASDLLIDLAGGLGKRLRLNEYFSGSLIVGIGISLPVLFASLTSVADGNASIVVPSVYASVIANIGAGFGLAVLALYVWIQSDTRWLPFTRKHACSGGVLNIERSDLGKAFVAPALVVAVSVLLSGTLFLDGTFGKVDAYVLLACYLAFLVWEWRRSREDAAVEPEELPEATVRAPTEPGWTRTLLILTAPLTLLALFTIAAMFASLDRLIDPRIFVQVLMFLVSAAIFFWLAGWGLYGMIGSSVFPLYLILIAGLFGFLFVRWLFSRHSAGRRPRIRDLWLHVLSQGSRWIALVFLIAALMLVHICSLGVVYILVEYAKDLGMDSPALTACALAFGASIPNVAVTISAARRGLHRMLTGHILHSCIFSVLLVVGLSGLASPLFGVFTGMSRLSVLFAALITVPLLIAIRRRRITPLVAIGLLACTLTYFILAFQIG